MTGIQWNTYRKTPECGICWIGVCEPFMDVPDVFSCHKKTPLNQCQSKLTTEVLVGRSNSFENHQLYLLQAMIGLSAFK